jgi:hypothetical protein
VQQAGHILQSGVEGEAARGQLAGFHHQAGTVARGQGFQHRQQVGLVDDAQHGAGFFLLHLAAAVGDGLVGEGQGVAHAAGGGSGQEVEGAGFEGDVLRFQHLFQVPGHLAGRHLLEIELEAAGQHRHRHLLGIGGGQDEDDVAGRFLQGLQHGVEGMLGEHDAPRR